MEKDEVEETRLRLLNEKTHRSFVNGFIIGSVTAISIYVGVYYLLGFLN